MFVTFQQQATVEGRMCIKNYLVIVGSGRKNNHLSAVLPLRKKPLCQIVQDVMLCIVCLAYKLNWYV
jgi:uncharacterized protein YifN (PemK superfamily)